MGSDRCEVARKNANGRLRLKRLVWNRKNRLRRKFPWERCKINEMRLGKLNEKRGQRGSPTQFLEWNSSGTRIDADTELIKKLRSEVDEWLSKRPPGFEDRQARMREQERVETTRAMEAWLQRKKRK